MEEKLSRDKIISIINKILLAEGTEQEEEIWLEQLSRSIPYYQEIYRIIAVDNEDLTAQRILEKAEKNYNPINLP